MSDNDNEASASSAAEALYDAEIAPVLEKLSRICEAKGMGFVASVEYDPGSMATTANSLAQASINGLMVLWASRSAGNLDKLALAAAAHVKASGLPHSSAVIEAMGVPMSGEGPPNPG
jgi:hypothetical protein